MSQRMSRGTSRSRPRTRLYAAKHQASDVLVQREVAFKASIVDQGARTFEGLLSVWGPDLGGDVMHKGAFKKTIGEWKKSPDALPLLNSHNHFDILSAVGQLLEAKETDQGLWTKWEVIDGPDGDAVLQRLRPSARTQKAPVSKMSIGYEPAKFDFEENDASPFGVVRNLREVNLKEGSLVIFPMAPGARIDSGTVKAIDLEQVKAFMASAAATPPQAVDAQTKLELRRVASRIGILLAPLKSATRPTDASGDQTQADPSAAQPTNSESHSEPPAEESPSTAAPTTDTPQDAEPPADGTQDQRSTKDQTDTAYLYADALQQRLQRFRTHNLIHDTSGAMQ